MTVIDRLDDYITITFCIVAVAMLLVSFGNGIRPLKKTAEPLNPWKPFCFRASLTPLGPLLWAIGLC